MTIENLQSNIYLPKKIKELVTIYDRHRFELESEANLLSPPENFEIIKWMQEVKTIYFCEINLKYSKSLFVYLQDPSVNKDYYNMQEITRVVHPIRHITTYYSNMFSLWGKNTLSIDSYGKQWWAYRNV